MGCAVQGAGTQGSTVPISSELPESNCVIPDASVFLPLPHQARKWLICDSQHRKCTWENDALSLSPESIYLSALFPPLQGTCWAGGVSVPAAPMLNLARPWTAAGAGKHSWEKSSWLCPGLGPSAVSGDINTVRLAKEIAGHTAPSSSWWIRVRSQALTGCNASHRQQQQPPRQPAMVLAPRDDEVCCVTQKIGFGEVL